MFGRVTNLLYFCTQIYFAMLFQDKLKELRESHNLLQRQVAAGIDMDTAVYCKIEKGYRQARRYKCASWLFSMVFHTKSCAVTGLQGRFTALLRKRKMQTESSIWWQKKWKSMAIILQKLKK